MTTYKEEVMSIKAMMVNIYNKELKALEEQLINVGAPYTPGRGYNNKN